MGWRLARSLVALRDEIQAVAPGTTVWTIGDAAHQGTWSDHNPNSAGVVCAADILGDGGLDLAEFAEQVRTSGHPAFKYVIYRDRIASAGGGWRPYGGQYHTHVHVSVGVGPDGRSTGPYDDTSPWGLATGGGSMIGLRKGNKGERVKALQELLRVAGFDPGETDGDYGDRTAAAVLACRRSVGSTTKDGNSISGFAYEQIHRAHAIKMASKAAGKPGPKGDPGPAGPPGTVDDAQVAAAIVRIVQRSADAQG